MLSGFKAFIARGNVLDLAVAVIIGAAFTKIVTSLTEDVIMPIIGALFGNLDFSNRYVMLGARPAGVPADATYAQLKEAGATMIGYGALISTAINFVIVAFFIYLIVSAVKRAVPDKVEDVADAADIVLLREIRDELKAQRAASSSTSH